MPRMHCSDFDNELPLLDAGAEAAAPVARASERFAFDAPRAWRISRSTGLSHVPVALDERRRRGAAVGLPAA